MGTNKTYREKARWELHKNATCCSEQILDTTPHKTATVQQPTSNLDGKSVQTFLFATYSLKSFKS